MHPPVSVNEAERLAELLGYAILDSEAEQAYDDITLLASQICETPIALVSLVDRERQWFKSRVGLDATETHRDLAFCAHAITTPTELFVVDDASADLRFSGNPLVTDDPNIRFYAGAPLTTSSGNAMGTLCVIDRVPRELESGQLDSLRALARMVVAQLELRQARDIAETADRNKLLFLANMSHEIRTPLNAILGLSELIGDETFGPVGDNRYREYANDINASGEHLLELMNDILDLSRIEAHERRLDEGVVDLVEGVGTVVRMLASRAGEKEIELIQEFGQTLPSVRVDARRIRQVVLNLVTNAIKFTPRGGSVVIAAGIDPSDGAVEISVTDSGIGMTAEDIETALTAFGQIDNDVTTEIGSGLGLPICKRLVEGHEGTLELQSEPGVGTTAVVRLPAQRVQSPRAA